MERVVHCNHSSSRSELCFAATLQVVEDKIQSFCAEMLSNVQPSPIRGFSSLYGPSQVGEVSLFSVKLFVFPWKAFPCLSCTEGIRPGSLMSVFFPTLAIKLQTARLKMWSHYPSVQANSLRTQADKGRDVMFLMRAINKYSRCKQCGSLRATSCYLLSGSTMMHSVIMYMHIVIKHE